MGFTRNFRYMLKKATIAFMPILLVGLIIGVTAVSGAYGHAICEAGPDDFLRDVCD